MPLFSLSVHQPARAASAGSSRLGRRSRYALPSRVNGYRITFFTSAFVGRPRDRLVRRRRLRQSCPAERLTSRRTSEVGNSRPADRAACASLQFTKAFRAGSGDSDKSVLRACDAGATPAGAAVCRVRIATFAEHARTALVINTAIARIDKGDDRLQFLRRHARSTCRKSREDFPIRRAEQLLPHRSI